MGFKLYTRCTQYFQDIPLKMSVAMQAQMPCKQNFFSILYNSNIALT